MVASRVFVANYPSDRIDGITLAKVFSKHGEVVGAHVNPKGFAFVQFRHKDDAQRAIQQENGRLFYGKQIG